VDGANDLAETLLEEGVGSRLVAVRQLPKASTKKPAPKKAPKTRPRRTVAEVMRELKKAGHGGDKGTGQVAPRANGIPGYAPTRQGGSEGWPTSEASMSVPQNPDPGTQPTVESPLLDVLIRAGLIFALAFLCYSVFAPFLTVMVWALILAVAVYPLQRWLARRVGGRQGLAATVIVLVGATMIVVPSAVLLVSLGDSIQEFVESVKDNTLRIPAPRPGVAEWPIVGRKVHAFWSSAHADLPALVQSLQPKIGDLARSALAFVAGIGGAILKFVVSFCIAGVIMAFGEAGARSSQAIFARIAGKERAPEFVKLSTATIRAVAQGVIGVAMIQAIAVGLTLLVAGVPFAGALALVVLVLGIAQIPALLVTVPAIAYIWMSGHHGTGAAVVYTIVLFVAGISDNFLKPLMLGRGVDAPMPVILLGALGGMAAAGILGLFVGATLLALGYQIFMGWVHSGQANAERPPAG
jgi:predicted PurR-regulated permease PerM